MKRIRRNTLRHRRVSGQAMIACLAVLAFVTAIIGPISMGLLLEARVTRNREDKLTTFYLARSGLEVGARLLLVDDRSSDALSDGWSSGAAELSKIELDDGSYSIMYRQPDTGERRYGIVDEERKLNINTADRGTIRALDPAFTEEIAKAIISRREKRPFASIQEIFELPGVPPDLLSKPTEELPGGIEGLLTVFGDGKVNVNTAPLHVLKCLEPLTAQQAELLVARRYGQDGEAGTADDAAFADLAEVRQFLLMNDETFARLAPLLTISSDYFTITATGRLTSTAVSTSELREVVRRGEDGLLVLRFEQLR